MVNKQNMDLSPLKVGRGGAAVLCSDGKLPPGELARLWGGPVGQAPAPVSAAAQRCPVGAFGPWAASRVTLLPPFLWPKPRGRTCQPKAPECTGQTAAVSSCRGVAGHHTGPAQVAPLHTPFPSPLGRVAAGRGWVRVASGAPRSGSTSHPCKVSILRKVSPPAPGARAPVCSPAPKSAHLQGRV